MRATRISPTMPPRSHPAAPAHRPERVDFDDRPVVTVSPRYDVERASDLRRRHARRLVEQLVAAATALPVQERLLIETTYGEGRSVTDIARLRGDDPRALRRRVRGIVRRVLDPEFAFVATHRHDWPRTRRRIAELTVLEGRSLRDVAAALRLSLHTVRRHRDAVRALAESLAPRRRPSVTELGAAADTSAW